MMASKRKPKLSFKERKPNYGKRAELIARAEAMRESQRLGAEKPKELKDLEAEIGREAALAGWAERKPGRPKPEV